MAKCLKRQVSATLGLKSRKKDKCLKRKTCQVSVLLSVCIAKCLKNVKSQTLGVLDTCRFFWSSLQTLVLDKLFENLEKNTSV